jgi:homogentisate 1,2-dioxygenase
MSRLNALIEYSHGFNNEHESEALPGALPVGQFNPQKCAYGLYAEQFSSTAFTASRHENRRTWMYRIRPSINMGEYGLIDKGLLRTAPLNAVPCPPNVMRWDTHPIPETPTDFIDGLTTIAANGDAKTQIGVGIHLYSANKSMGNRYLCNADGELLFVPEHGEFIAYTELGRLEVKPTEILVIPKGIKFKIEPKNDAIKGYLCENYGLPFTLPERGPVGANGFANQRDFYYPTAWFEDNNQKSQLITKFCGELYQAELNHSPLNVVAWVGNSAPYKYDLNRFNVINTVSFDHPDPSIFTVLTSHSDTQGMANMDFVIFPPRWMVAENTFRPPWFHRNIMSEFMGLIQGTYDAKEKGFAPGGMSLHNSMTPHGPEAAVFEKASNETLMPQKYANTMAFMFESRYVIAPTEYALHSPLKQNDYLNCWDGLKKHFDGRQ